MEIATHPYPLQSAIFPYLHLIANTLISEGVASRLAVFVMQRQASKGDFLDASSRKENFLSPMLLLLLCGCVIRRKLFIMFVN